VESGRHLVEDETTVLTPIFTEMETTPGVDLLAPLGTLSFDVPFAEDDIDKSLEYPVPSTVSSDPSSQSTNANLDRNQDSESWVEVDVHIDRPFSESMTDDTDVLVISDPIATLLFSEKLFWICIGEVNNIQIDGNFAASVPIEMLDEDTVTISCQMLGLCPATTGDDPEQKHDWRTYTITERSFMAPGHLIQVVNSTLSKTHTNILFYLFQSSVLIALTASIYQGLTTPHLKAVPKTATSQVYPYREASGK
jgi:hypothetical protein